MTNLNFKLGVWRCIGCGSLFATWEELDLHIARYVIDERCYWLLEHGKK